MQLGAWAQGAAAHRHREQGPEPTALAARHGNCNAAGVLALARSPHLTRLEVLNLARNNAVVMDLLERSGAGVWHQPTIEEIRAEAAIET
jgi:hypothetical protein